jgi:hypothetical protein
VATSNLPEEGDGRKVWAQRVRPARVDPSQVGGHVAVLTLVEPGGARPVGVYGYHVEFLDRMERKSGRARLVAGTLRIRSKLTEAATTLCFAGLHLGEQHVTGGLRTPPEPAEWAAIVDELGAALQHADVFAAQRAIDRHFPGTNLSLGALLPGSRERVLTAVLADAITSAADELDAQYEANAPLIRWLVTHDLPIPDVLHATVRIALHRRVLANLRALDPSFHQLREHLAEAAQVKVNLDTPEVALAATDGLRRLIDRLSGPDGELDSGAVETVARAAEVAARMKTAPDLWFAQNATFRLLERLPGLRRRAADGDGVALGLVGDLERLATALRLAIVK